ncbi:Protein CBG05500 [Caenorhabditis briggsae]|uniref:Protein CBG05500 n=1 Tax=Caenorhabditis briggsae TaxID=6238 RepID=A8X010_CAEBR|nr:Protein CBG05500 [Caenorhabditis briggsae]CAP25970.2 Protein CBG05500 [Caenorhabditis briggsae]
MADAIDKAALKEFGEEILGKVAELINLGVDKKKKEKEVEEEKPPKVSSKGIQKNIDFNFKIKNVLSKAMAADDLENGVKEVLELIKSRNGELLLLDSDPNLLQTKEKLDALKAISGGDSEGSSTQADMTSILLLSNLTGIAGKKSGGYHGDVKRRRQDPLPSRQQWFRSEGVFRGQGNTRQNGGQGYGGRDGKRSIRCYKCQGYGHYANDCEQRRLSEAIEFWENICNVEWVLSVIEDGYKIQLNSETILPEPQGLRPSVKRHEEFLIAEIKRLEEEGVVVRVEEEPRCVSPLHVVEQGKKKRMILDLSELNESLVPPRFKLENLKTAWPFLENAKFAATFDFKSGYHHIKIHRDSRDLLGFSLSNPPAAPYFLFKGLPFGLSIAPWLFTKIFKVLVQKWRAEGIKIFLYLDDGLVVGETEREVARAVRKVREDLHNAGVCVAEEKSFWVPDAKFTWLGYECDLVAKEVRGTEKRMATWWSALDELRRSLAPTVLDRMKFLGCQASFELVTGDIGVAKARWMMQVVGENQKKKSESKMARKNKSPGEEKEIEFWRARGAELLRRNLLEVESKPDLFLYTDASARGIGGLLKNERQDILWKMTEIGDGNFEKQSSAWRELTAVEVASARISSNLKGRVQVLVDSQAAVSVLRRGSMKPELHSLAERVWHNLENVGESSFLWIPRKENVEADEASGNFDFDDWGIAERVFSQAQRMWGEIKVDWFADANNKKTELYFLDIPSLERAESTSSSTSREQSEWDFLEGPKKDYIEEIERQAGKEFQTHLDKLKAAPLESKASSTALAYKAENKRRKDWIIEKRLPLNESSFLLYLVDRAKGIGSSALSKISAAYQAAIFSFHVMLRASEAAEIKWEGVTQKDGMIEVHVEKAKNDQWRLGRSSFFNYDPGSDADILMCRWRIHSRGKCPYVFSNLDGSKKLTKSSISALATKMLAAIGKSGATHHAFRRGGANHMRATGYSMEEIQARGRWRSLAGLQRYIKDVPRAQGCLHPQENGIGVEEDDEDFE